MNVAFKRPDLLVIRAVTSYRCNTCLTEQKPARSQDPSLVLPPGNSVSTSLLKFQAKEVITRNCFKCKQDRSCSSVTTFTDLPEVLVLNVRRSEFDPKSGVHRRLSGNVACDKTLSLTLDGDGPTVAYRLSSVIHHSGTPEKGHYTSTLCDHNSSKMWSCNDSSVKQLKRINYKSACIFLYRKEE